jgi:hypothetical protein
MKVKVAMYKMKVKDIKSVINLAELDSWAQYTGDFHSTYSSDVKNKTNNKYVYGYRGKRTIYLSAN